MSGSAGLYLDPDYLEGDYVDPAGEAPALFQGPAWATVGLDPAAAALLAGNLAVLPTGFVPALLPHRGGPGPREDGRSVNLGALADRSAANAVAVLAYAVAGLLAALDAVEAARAALQAKLDAEAVARTGTDAALAAALDAEEGARSSGDSSLAGQIAALSGQLGSAQAALAAAIDARAPKDSPALAGTPTTTYAPAGDHSDRIASTAWVLDNTNARFTAAETQIAALADRLDRAGIPP